MPNICTYTSVVDQVKFRLQSKPLKLNERDDWPKMKRSARAEF